MMKKLYYICIAALLLMVYACDDRDAGKGVFAENEDVPVSMYLENDTDFGFSLWVEIMRKADLYNALNINGNNTCFVPTDNAVTEYMSKNNLSSVSEISVDDAKLLIKYHTISGKSIKHSAFEDGVIADTTASGDFLSIEIREGGLNQIYVNGEARIEKLSISVSNGVIHVLENVLTPITETVYSMLSKPEYSIFKELVDVTGYADRLNIISTIENNIERKYKYTLFVETNDVFGEYNSVAKLAAYLGAKDDNYKDQANELNRFVAYHILTQQYGFTDLAAASTNIAPLLSSELMSLSDIDGTFYINYDKTTLEGIKLQNYNINCKNGIVHEINSILEITLPEAATIIWEFTDYAELASLFSYYRVTSTSSITTGYIKSEDVTCYKWNSVPDYKMDNCVAYYMAASDNIRKAARNGDYLMLSLGMSGWIEMEIPTIMRGKYKMTINYYSPGSTTKGGLLSFFLDGDNIKSLFVNGDGSAAVFKKNVELATIEFTESTSHTLRILAGDDSTTYIDCITFTPVN